MFLAVTVSYSCRARLHLAPHAKTDLIADTSTPRSLLSLIEPLPLPIRCHWCSQASHLPLQQLSPRQTPQPILGDCCSALGARVRDQPASMANTLSLSEAMQNCDALVLAGPFMAANSHLELAELATAMDL